MTDIKIPASSELFNPDVFDPQLFKPERFADLPTAEVRAAELAASLPHEGESSPAEGAVEAPPPSVGELVEDAPTADDDSGFAGETSSLAREELLAYRTGLVEIVEAQQRAARSELYFA